MRIEDELQQTRLAFRELAEASGVDYAYLRQLSSGKQGAGEPILRALARGLARHAVTLLRVAGTFLDGSGDAGLAARARELGKAVEEDLAGERGAGADGGG